MRAAAEKPDGRALPGWTPDRTAPGWTAPALAGVLASLVFAILIAAPSPLVLMAIGVIAVALGGIALEWQRERLMSLDVMVYGFILLTFGARPLFVAAHAGELGSWRPAHTADQYLGVFRSQEIAEFVSQRVTGDVGRLLIGAELIGVVFLACFLVGRIAASRTSVVAPGRRAFPEALAGRRLTLLVGGLAGVGLVGQVIVIVSVGGVGQALANLESQLTLRQSFAGFVLANFVVAACLVWAAYGRLRGPAGLAFAALLAEVVLFAALTGSRTRTFLPLLAVAIVIHLCRRRFRVAEALGFIACALVLAAMLLAFRQTSSDRPLGEALTAGLSEGASLQVLANDYAAYDSLVMLDALVPDQIPHQDGGRLVAGATSALPAAVYPAKAEAGDVWFRRQVWGDTRQAGRPYTLPGELWLDFSWIGLSLGALGLGALCGRLRWRRGVLVTPGQALVAALAGITAWELLNGVWSSASSVLVEFGAPLGAAALGAAALAARRAGVPA